mmetsp:Transcript_43059/g.49480  ORF Transcript_43059/g.49480 Transcript_43059/m.49480 type:complete len:192 (-) Transcript_43059:1090-1665(-)
MSSLRIKVLLIGPCRGGKSTLANILSEQADNSSGAYRPTAGVRILEFEKEIPKMQKRHSEGTITVELWDLSGDSKYESCWPAVQDEADGIVFIFDPTNPDQEGEMDSWVTAFPRQMDMHPSMCIGLANHFDGQGASLSKKSNPPKGLTHLTIYDCSVENNTAAKVGFDRLFETLVSKALEKQDSEEMNLVK